MLVARENRLALCSTGGMSGGMSGGVGNLRWDGFNYQRSGLIGLGNSGNCGCNNCNYCHNIPGGLRGLYFDGTGLLGTGLFSGDVSTWGISEIILGMVGMYAVYAMFFQAKQTKYRLEATAGRRRKRRASSLRARAKRLEEQTEGLSIF